MTFQQINLSKDGKVTVPNKLGNILAYRALLKDATKRDTFSDKINFLFSHVGLNGVMLVEAEDGSLLCFENKQSGLTVVYSDQGDQDMVVVCDPNRKNLRAINVTDELLEQGAPVAAVEYCIHAIRPNIKEWDAVVFNHEEDSDNVLWDEIEKKNPDVALNRQTWASSNAYIKTWKKVAEKVPVPFKD